MADTAFEPIIFLSPYFSDLATLVASSEASVNTPVSLLQTKSPYEKWRSTTTTPYITIDMGEAVAADMLVLVASNLLPGDTIRIRANSITNMAAAPLDVSQDAWFCAKPTRQFVRCYSNRVRFTNSTAYRYWRIDITASGGQTYVEAGRLMLGPTLQPEISIDIGGGVSFVSPDAQEFTDYLYTAGEDHGLGIRKVSLKFSQMVETDAFSGFLEFRQLRGKNGDFFIDLFPWRDDGWTVTAFQAVFTNDTDFEARPMWDGGVQVWGTTVAATEVAL